MFWDVFYNLCVKNEVKPNAVCRELKFSTATATHWKNGTTPNGDALIKIADRFGCSVDYLLERTENPSLFTDDIVPAGDINNISNSNVGAIGNRGTVNINTVSETDGQDVFSNQFIEAFNALDLMDKVEVINFTLSKMKK